MHENEYAYAVARVRANELTLLTPAETEQLITAENYGACVRMLSDKGWQTPDDSHSYATMLEERMAETWELLRECAPDISLLDALVITNDFFNLKAAFKAKFSDLPAQEYMTSPSVYDPQMIVQAVEENDLDTLPECMRDCAKKAYDAIVRLESGRLADTAIDLAALKARAAQAEKSGSELMKNIVDISTAAADIKTAIRCSKAGRTAEYIADAVCGSGLFDASEMIDAALKGEAALSEFLLATPISSIAESLKQGLTAFEKACEDEAAGLIEAAKYTAFGPDPLVAFFIARDTEVKNARIILSAKLNGFPPETIRARVREVYA